MAAGPLYIATAWTTQKNLFLQFDLLQCGVAVAADCIENTSSLNLSIIVLSLLLQQLAVL
jgi:hypothetical protein